MAGATSISVLPLLSTHPSPQLLLPSSKSLLLTSSFYHCSNKFRRFTNPRFTIPNAKIGEEVSEEIHDGTIFDLMEEDDSDVEDDEEEEDTESSLDLLSRFVGSMFKKLSRRVRKESRSVLPEFVSPRLVSFSVDGVLLLALLSIAKALLEVVCTLGGTVFVVVLMIRVIAAAVSYFQSSKDSLNQNGPSYGRTQPVA